ncbi:MAG: PP2C family protein-serine/threonine phosphatase [Ilumatobacteraceae bacterium]
MGALVQGFDWSSTSLGPPRTWSIALRTAVSVCLTSRFPILVVWGPDLVKIYNDGYRVMLGTEKHPRALGAPAKEIWPEIWDTIGPMFAGVIATGQPTWVEDQALVLERNGYQEECNFTYSFSPLFDDDGTIRGVLNVATETTKQVIAQRRLICLTDLSAALFEAEHVTDVFVRAATALSQSRADVSAADFHVRVADQLVLVASNRRRGVSPIGPDLLLQVARDRVPTVVDGSFDGAMPAGHFVAPVGADGVDGVEGVFVASLNPRRPFDETYAEFLRLVGDIIGTAVRSSFRRTTEVDEYRLISERFQEAMLKPAIDLPTVAARYLPAVGNLAVGGDWYDVMDLGVDGRAIVVGDCVGHGLAAATVMAQLRSATRAMLLDGSDPAAALEGLDLFAATIEGAYCATVVCAVIDRRQEIVTYSRAGHLPPLIVSGDGTTWLDLACGVPVGVRASKRRTNATHRLNQDDVIIMYSDGLIERRGENLDVGLQRLATAASALYGSNVQGLADGLLFQLQPENTRDDVVLVVKHMPAHLAPVPPSEIAVSSR